LQSIDTLFPPTDNHVYWPQQEMYKCWDKPMSKKEFVPSIRKIDERRLSNQWEFDAYLAWYSLTVIFASSP